MRNIKCGNDAQTACTHMPASAPRPASVALKGQRPLRFVPTPKTQRHFRTSVFDQQQAGGQGVGRDNTAQLELNKARANLPSMKCWMSIKGYGAHHQVSGPRLHAKSVLLPANRLQLKTQRTDSLPLGTEALRSFNPAPNSPPQKRPACARAPPLPFPSLPLKTKEQIKRALFFTVLLCPESVSTSVYCWALLSVA